MGTSPTALGYSISNGVSAMSVINIQSAMSSSLVRLMATSPLLELTRLLVETITDSNISNGVLRIFELVIPTRGVHRAALRLSFALHDGN